MTREKFLPFVGVISALLLFAAVIEASDSNTVNFGANSSITAFTTCKKVTNGSATGLNVYVPTQSSAEWASFYTNPPAGVTIGSCGPATTQVIFLTSGSTWTVPADWNPSNNKIEVIGGGGNGATMINIMDGGGGGGGGSYSKISNVTLASGTSISYVVGGASGDTYFNGASCGTALACAKGGASASTYQGRAGGSAADGVGTVKYSGGNGGNGMPCNGCPVRFSGLAGGGGGGSAGPNGNGLNGGGGSSNGGGNGGTGDSGYGGSGGGGCLAGNGGTEWNASHGSGGGGGGGGGNGCLWAGAPGAPAGTYGAGGGGSTRGNGNAYGGPGAQGIIVITYGP